MQHDYILLPQTAAFGFYTAVYGSTNLSSTHPDSESEFDVFGSPDLHVVVEAADGQEVVLADGQCAADQRRRAMWHVLVLIRESPLLMLWHLHPHIPANISRTLHDLVVTHIQTVRLHGRLLSTKTLQLEPIPTGLSCMWMM